MTLNGTPAQMKSVNKKRVLQCIQENSPISRAEIAVKVGISKPTVSLLVDELLQEKWILEKGTGEASSQGGRRPIQLHFNERAAYIVGTDIGGTKVKTVICDLFGNIICTRSFKTSQYLQSGLLNQISKDIECMIQKSNIDSQKILGMGAGVPGITEQTSGVVIEAPSLNWVRYPFIKEAKRIFPFQVYVDNDVNVAALGEQWLGNAKNKENVLFIAVGTGIGSGIIIHNQLYRGFSSAAGELGYMVTDKNDMKNAFQPIFHRYGYLESVAGGKAIGDRLTKLIQQQPKHPLYERANGEELPGEMAFALAREGDKTAIDVIEEAVEHLAYGIINAACLLNPEVIILGGGVLKSSELILPSLLEIVNQYLPSSVELKISQLQENAGVLGAVSLFLREHESIIKLR
ncbi:ROK family transcriptional regulator [Bacillus sp. V33-4]|uniref:ROK family transcriptional regulator n=1 Tax=Bacillus sp. V33-4 TaxID=2054169 RepID=UPI000C78B864|nr:ROK family transcriptional regulator [Bacillus sp. V33-4]PLR86449.1 ROK family transcriptional regulator [Bacillus sp. V33-4]